MDDKACTTRAITTRETNVQGWSLYTNVTVVIDRNWPFQDFKELILYVHFRDDEIHGDDQIANRFCGGTANFLFQDTEKTGGGGKDGPEENQTL